MARLSARRETLPFSNVRLVIDPHDIGLIDRTDGQVIILDPRDLPILLEALSQADLEHSTTV